MYGYGFRVGNTAVVSIRAQWGERWSACYGTPDLTYKRDEATAVLVENAVQAPGTVRTPNGNMKYSTRNVLLWCRASH